MHGRDWICPTLFFTNSVFPLVSAVLPLSGHTRTHTHTHTHSIITRAARGEELNWISGAPSTLSRLPLGTKGTDMETALIGVTLYGLMSSSYTARQTAPLGIVSTHVERRKRGKSRFFLHLMFCSQWSWRWKIGSRSIMNSLWLKGSNNVLLFILEWTYNT